jgi:hypothetical protein
LDGGAELYTAGHDAEVIQLLSAAIRENSVDPRPYYLRGLSLLRLGRIAEARADLALGGQLEARQPNAFDVDALLRQLPAAGRQLVERYRYRARTGESLDSTYLNESGAGGNVGVLRQKISVPLEHLAESGSLAEWLESRRAGAQQAGPQMISPAVATGTIPGAQDDPFVDDPHPAIETSSTEAQSHVSPAAFSDEPTGGKIPSGKLFGILGRAIGSAAPVPSLDGLRQKAPAWAVPPTNAYATATPAAAATTPMEQPAESTAEEEDPFGF